MTVYLKVNGIDFIKSDVTAINVHEDDSRSKPYYKIWMGNYSEDWDIEDMVSIKA